MINFTPTLAEYDKDTATKKVRTWLNDAFKKDEGVCYYKHPVVQATTGLIPDLALFTRSHQPLIVKCLPYQVAEISQANNVEWLVNAQTIESPVLTLEDFIEGLKYKFNATSRVIRHRLEPQAVLALPLISQTEFEKKFGLILKNIKTIWRNGEVNHLIQPLDLALTEEEWRHTRSIVQGVSPLKQSSPIISTQATTLGEAIRILDREIALLDNEQEKAALQIPPGPQQIRGLAGTGKTVLLAMRAAKIHFHYPDKKILFTFNTRSLYNQARSLISKFYRHHSNGLEPNWEMLHIRHSWGGTTTGAGVYYDLCTQQNIKSLNLSQARSQNPQNPFRQCCINALTQPITPEYDYILVDEAQDFPKEFFQILYKLLFPPYQICWVYDELQSLSNNKFPAPEELFGVDENGKPYISLQGEPYPANIEKDLILSRSYRCPQAVLMLAHAIGLGLYNEKGCVQILKDKASWEAVGYKLESGRLVKGEKITIYRPPENSPNPITHLYTGSQSPITTQIFPSREAELQWIAQAIQTDISQEHVAPEQIMVICLDTPNLKFYLATLQKYLWNFGIASIIPGLNEQASAFAEKGKVTLSSVFRAKGNEAYIVYVLSFESLYDYVEAIENRNTAFTAISRSKAWVRITGVGEKMELANQEIDRILADQPRFKFKFPDLELIKQLGKIAEQAKQAEKITSEFTALNPKILATLSKDRLNQLQNLIAEAQREYS